MSLDERQKSFVRLLTQHERGVYAYILKLVLDWNEANEILQETNVRLWEEFGRFQPGTNFGAWARTIAHYQVLAWRKRRHRSRLVFDNETVECLAVDADGDDDSATDESRRLALAKCVEQLSSRNRDLLARCYAAKASIRGVAEELCRSTDAVYKALQRIRVALHRCVEQRLAQEGTP